VAMANILGAKVTTRAALSSVNQCPLLQSPVADSLIACKGNQMILSAVGEPYLVRGSERYRESDPVEGDAFRSQRRNQRVRKYRLVDVEGRR
jgi:hypothetical protein